MARALSFLAATLLLGWAGPSWASDAFCQHIQEFEESRLTKSPDGGLQRRWIDFIWMAPAPSKTGDVQIGFGLKCIGSDDVAKSLCAYAVHHTSYEFPSDLPLHILGCHGFVLPPKVRQRRWIQEFDWDAPHDDIEQLQIDQLERDDADPRIRLTILPYPESPDAKKPPPFFGALSAKLGLESEE